jgi:hypothetical protein
VQFSQRDRRNLPAEVHQTRVENHLALLRRCRENTRSAHAAVRRAYELLKQTRALVERSRNSLSP